MYPKLKSGYNDSIWKIIITINQVRKIKKGDKNKKTLLVLEFKTLFFAKNKRGRKNTIPFNKNPPIP